MKALGDYMTRTNTTQLAMAKQVGVSQPTIANLVNGVHSASADLLKRLSIATGLTVDQLLADKPLTSANHPARARFHGCTRGE
jgi:transcriptional regulator with XRE-family HTH domain